MRTTRLCSCRRRRFVVRGAGSGTTTDAPFIATTSASGKVVADADAAVIRTLSAVTTVADAAAAVGAIWAADSWFDLCRGAYSVWSQV